MLGQRVAVAAVGIPIIFALIWIGGWPFAIVVAIALAIAAAEFAHLRYPWGDFVTVALVTTVGTASLLAHEDGGWWAAALIGFALPGALITFRYRGVDYGGFWGATRAARWIVSGSLYVGVLGGMVLFLRDIENGRDWMLLALFSTFAVDTSAYFTGRAIGRHKMAPAISPKKTWEGFAGGYIGGAAVVLALAYVLDVGINVPVALLIAATLPVAAAAGDLFESWIKRRTGVKDASDLIPGHGGVLDRLDSLLFVFPLVWVMARWVA